MPEPLTSVFFSPCAWDMAWHAGAARALLETKVLDRVTTLGGGSGGAFVAVVLASGLPYHEFDFHLDRMVLRAKGHRAFRNVSGLLSESMDDLMAMRDQTNPKKEWLWKPYATVTVFGKVWPYLGAEIMEAPLYQDTAGIKDLVMASCYIPGYFEAAPKLNGARAYDGGFFIWDIRVPGVLNVAPHRPYGHNCIGYSEAKPYYLCGGSYLPSMARIHELREAGYESALRWIREYGGVP